MRIGILTGGGDCPGLNAVIRAAVRATVIEYGGTAVGFHDAWRGVMEDRWEPLTIDRCRGILPRGGTILGSSRDQPYAVDGGVDRVREVMDRHALDAFVAIGGEGSMGVLNDLHRDGIPVVGVPKTIDNDIAVTEMTFGFQTAVATATDAIDKLHTTAESHDRVMILEVMGRDAGWIALCSGIAGGADTILLPEIPFEVDSVAMHIKRRRKQGNHFAIVVVAEGAFPRGGTPLTAKERKPGQPNPILGGVGRWLGDELEARGFHQTRVCVLGHLQRGGIPSAMDRLLATRYGVAAVDAIARGESGVMVALRGTEVITVDIREALENNKLLDPALYETAEVFFG